MTLRSSDILNHINRNRLTKRILAGIFGLILILPELFGQCYELVWSDEFNGTELDTSFWQFQTGGNNSNNELQYYTDRTENLEVKDGFLTITAREEQYQGSDYTSARINTRDKFSFKYGKIEARIKNPYGQGIWPALWMLGDSYETIGWPECGEIDIMEMVGGEEGDNTVHSTLHWGEIINGGWPNYGLSYTLPSGIFADDFHIIETVWDEDFVITYCDGEEFYKIDIRSNGLAAFHEKFYMIINLAVGGNWPGSPDATTVFPQSFQIDYVRLYQTMDWVDIEGPDEVYASDSLLVFSLPEVDGWTYNWTVGDGIEIIGRSDSSSITVNWNCDASTIACNVSGNCNNITYQKDINIKNLEIEGPVFFSGNDIGMTFSAPLLHSTTYTWSVPADATISSGQGTNSIIVDWGTTEGEVQVDIDNDCGLQTVSKMIYLFGQYPYPDPGQPHIIPGIINATDYDYGGEGVAYHDVEPENLGDGLRQDEGVDTQFSDNGGPNTGWIISGEWLEYTVSVNESREYSISVRVASNISGARGPLNVLANGESRAVLQVPNTNAWDQFTTIETNINLLEEDTLIRLEMGAGDFNIGDISFGDPILSTGIQSVHSVKVFPNPFLDQITIESAEPLFGLRILDATGQLILTMKGEGRAQLQIQTGFLSSGVYIVILEYEEYENGIFRLIK